MLNLVVDLLKVINLFVIITPFLLMKMCVGILQIYLQELKYLILKGKLFFKIKQ